MEKVPCTHCFHSSTSLRTRKSNTNVIIRTCFKLSRDDKPKIYNPQPDQLDDARRKLSTYTTCSTVAQRTGGRNADIEAVAPPSEFGEW
ncbi:hypothetical protein AUP68_14428 [Ilyonectria robusta]